MEEAVNAMTRPGTRLVDRLVATLLFVLMALGSLALWLAVPAGVLWGFTQLSDSKTFHLFVGLIGVPLAIGVFAAGLFWINGLYLRVTGSWTYDEDEDRPRRLRGPLEPLLVWSLLIAIAAISVWFFAFADDPPSPAPF